MRDDDQLLGLVERGLDLGRAEEHLVELLEQAEALVEVVVPRLQEPALRFRFRALQTQANEAQQANEERPPVTSPPLRERVA